MPVAYRITYFLQQGVTGWSESFHTTLQTETALGNLITNYTNARFAFLSNTVNLVSVRVSDDLKFRDIPLRPIVANVKGVLAGNAAIPDSTAVFLLASGDTYVRYLYCRGLPSGYTKGRSFNRDWGAWPALVAFREFLKSNNIAVFAQSSPQTAVLTTDYDPNTGLWTVQAPIADLAARKYVTITAPRGVKIPRGKFQVATAPSSTTFTLLKWAEGDNPKMKAFVRLSDKTLHGVDKVEINDVGERKVGRPFGQPRGRARARTS